MNESPVYGKCTVSPDSGVALDTDFTVLTDSESLFLSETGEKGEAKSSFVVNESPVYGKCTVSPDSGVALETDFTVHCTD